MKKTQLTHSHTIDAERTTVFVMDKETCVKLINDLIVSVSGIPSAGRIVLRENDSFFVFKVDEWL